MISKSILASDEISFIKKRYPMVDCDNLEIPVMGMATITSLEYLESSLKFDIENRRFEKYQDPSSAFNTCLSIKKKIDCYRKKDKDCIETEESTMKKTEERSFDIYSEQYVSLKGKIKDGCLALESNVYGEDYDSEKFYDFSKEETEKLFDLISLENFIELCRREHLVGMEKYLSDNQISYRSFTY